MDMATLLETVLAEGRAFYRASSWLLWAFSLFSRSLLSVPKHVGNRVDHVQDLLAEEAAAEIAIEIVAEVIHVMIQGVDHQVRLSHQNAGNLINMLIVAIIVGIRPGQIVLMGEEEDVATLQRTVIV